jgi:hypothetical protein
MASADPSPVVHGEPVAEAAPETPTESVDLALDSTVHEPEGGSLEPVTNVADQPAGEAPIIDSRPKIESALTIGLYDGEPHVGDATTINAIADGYPDGVVADRAERAQALEALVHVGVSAREAGALWSVGMSALKTPLATNQSGALQSLGADADALVADAKEVVAKAEKSWPGIKDFLNRTGLGNDPATIRFLAARRTR